MGNRYQCPVCGRENETLQCTSCGFDGSRDYERYPTLQSIPKNVKAIFARSYRQNKMLCCEHCGGKQFFLRSDLSCVCSSCGAVRGEDHSQSDVRQDETIPTQTELAAAETGLRGASEENSQQYSIIPPYEKPVKKPTQRNNKAQAENCRVHIIVACMAIIAVVAFCCSLSICADRIVTGNIMLGAENPEIRETVEGVNNFFVYAFNMRKGNFGEVYNRWGVCLNPSAYVTSTDNAIYLLASSVGMLILPFLITGLSAVEYLRKPIRSNTKIKYITWCILLVLCFAVMEACANRIVTGNIMLGAENPEIREAVEGVNNFFVFVFGMGKGEFGSIESRWGYMLNPLLDVTSTTNAIRIIFCAVIAQVLPVVLFGAYSRRIFREKKSNVALLGDSEQQVL